MKSPQISVMMPVYNGAEWLDESIPSVLSQTFRDFELLIVDDVSTDSSFDLMQKYARLDRRIRLFQNEKNIGAGRSLNFLMTKVIGEYLCFIGQDDLYKTTYLEEMLCCVKKGNSDFAACGFKIFGSCSREVKPQSNSGIYSGVEFLNTETHEGKLVIKPYPVAEWTKIIKKDFIFSHNIQFGRNVNFDFPFHLQLVWFSKKVSLVHEALYFHRTHPKQVSARVNDFAASDFASFKELERFHRKYLPWDAEFFKFIRPLSGLMYRKHKWKVKLEVWKHKLICKMYSLFRNCKG
ncbi:MAG: glycosyltransferase family 2 protein [Alphaproteobacteria bacterium]|nr:glycosyltransferase family 2 protein [Alphaproteobacteria bacterium]